MPARPELRREPAPVHRPVRSQRACPAARAVHPRRLLAIIGAVAVQPHGARPQRARRLGGGHRLRSAPARVDRRHHRADPPRLHIPVAAHRTAHDGVRPFRWRPPRRRHGSDRLADLYPRAGDLVPAACSISGLFDLTPLVGISMNQDLRLDDASARAASPLFWPAPTGRRSMPVGGDESSEFRGRAACWPMPGARPACTRATRRSARPTISP